MIFCKELNRGFATKEEMLKGLVESKEEIYSLKKATVKRSDAIPSFGENRSGAVVKAEGTDQSAPLKVGDTLKNAINSIGILDSHQDVHIRGIWKKTAKEQSGKLYHANNHTIDLTNLVAYPKDTRLDIEEIAWKDLNQPYTGTTEVLVAYSKTSDKTHDKLFMAYRDKEPVEHSVSMEYVNLFLCVNDKDSEDLYKNWLQYYPHVVNKEVADELGYFWAVTEAKLKYEFSTVPYGSNHVTQSLGYSTNEEPLKSTPNEPPEKLFELSEAIKHINFFNN